MSAVKGVGISVQKSKYAALAIDSLSDDSEDGNWTQIKPTNTNVGKQWAKGKQTKTEDKQGETRSQSKNAKKRARKKRQQALSQSSDTKDADSALQNSPDPISSGVDWEQEVRMRNQAAADLEFQKDLEKAILLSKADAQEHAKALEESRVAERIAVAESLSAPKGLSTSKPGGKKGVTLSLQQFHRRGAPESHKSSSMDPHSQLSEILMDDPLPVTPTTPKDSFFSRLSESVQEEVSKEERPRAERRISESHQEPTADELPRIAQLKDDLEKKETLIEQLQKQNELLKKKLKEVKQRNQSLCKILSQGEFSTKTQLIEQVEQLTTVKNELTEEVQSLHSSLEQEKSKNKTLKLELARYLGGSAKTTRTASTS